jgi:uncharacterized membrane protein YeaQ/YmgE (transglycosylase-associated protein family)
MHVTGIVTILLVGLVAGGLAHLIAGGRGSLLGNLCVGLLGSLVGSYLAEVFSVSYDGVVGSIIASTVGALALLAVFGLISRRKA